MIYEVVIAETRSFRQIVTVRANSPEEAGEIAQSFLEGDDDSNSAIISHDERDDGSDYGGVIDITEESDEDEKGEPQCSTK